MNNEVNDVEEIAMSIPRNFNINWATNEYRHAPPR